MPSAMGAPHPSLELLHANDDVAWKLAYPALWSAAASVVHHRLGMSGLDLENLVSEVICAEVMPGVLHRSSPAFQEIATFEELLRLTRTIAQRRCIDRIRSAMRRKETLTEEPPEPEAFSPSNEGGHSYTWAEWMTLIQEALDPPDPDLFHDRFALGLTTREIATRRGMPHGTVVSRFARALKRLAGKVRHLDAPGLHA